MPDEMLNLPVIPLRGLTILPGTTVHFDVSRKQSIAAANEAVTTGEKLFVVTQKDPVVDAPGFDDVYKVGTVVEVKQLNKMPDRIVRVMVEAKERGIIHSYNEENSCIKGDIEIIKEPNEKITQVREIALLRELKDELALYDGINHELTPVGIKNIDNQESLSGTMLQIIMRIRMDFKTKQKYLEANTLLERYEVILSFFSIENEISQVKAEIIEKVKTNIDKNQREHILREQMRVIRDELGENDATSDIDEMIEKTKKLNADDEIKEKMGVDVVRFRRKSDGMKLVQSDIDEALKRVCLIYSNEETIIEYQMVFNYKEQSHGYDVEDKKIKEEQIEVDGNKIDIIQYELSDGSEENIAQFKYEDVFYILNTTMKEEEFKKILKNLFFF